jgi:putative transposase
MPRTARASRGDICYHVINRGNARQAVFLGEEDYVHFETLLAKSLEHVPMRIIGYCLMPNHFHLVAWPRRDGDLSRWMQRLLTAHVRHHHARHASTGHIWQGRFKAFPIERDEHLMTVLRYVERNALRAGLVRKAEDWHWSSLGPLKSHISSTFLHPGPIERPRGWNKWVNEPMNEIEEESIRRCVNREAPYGRSAWVKHTATALGLESSINSRGRPRKESRNAKS